jgi:hypothetical protein
VHHVRILLGKLINFFIICRLEDVVCFRRRSTVLPFVGSKIALIAARAKATSAIPTPGRSTGSPSAFTPETPLRSASLRFAPLHGPSSTKPAERRRSPTVIMGKQPRQWPIIAKRAKIAKDPRLARNRANKEQTGKRRVGAFVTLFSSPSSCFFLQKIKEERLRTYTCKDVYSEPRSEPCGPSPKLWLIRLRTSPSPSP